jgi:hypothetical protein
MKSKMVIVLAALSLMGVGCAKEKSRLDSNAVVVNGFNGPTFPPSAPPGAGAGSAGDSWNYGSTVDFRPTSIEVMEDYVASHPLNNPSDFKININLQDVTGGASVKKYAGHVKIRYADNGATQEGYFQSGTGTVRTSWEGRDTGKVEAEYNQWFTFNGKEAFHAFFQDRMGAIVIVIDQTLDLGDGAGSDTVAGSVWYKNFGVTNAPASPEKCWFVRIGPMDCRTFMPGDGSSTPDAGSNIVTTSALFPSNGYKKLGTFTGLSRSKAFNE